MNKHLTYTLGLLLLLSIFFIIYGFHALFSPAIKQSYVYYLRPGTSKKTMIAELTQQKILTHPILFSLYVNTQPNLHLKSGEYLFQVGSTPHSILKQITAGNGLLYHAFSIIPGWSFAQLRKELNQVEWLEHKTKLLNNNQIMTHFGFPTLSPEGEFFPDTYYYTRGIPDWVILDRAFKLMQKKLTLAWYYRNPDLPYSSAYEALIAASLIEKEAYLNSERPVISGVLINRLKKGMPLQFDPTIIYGLGERYDGTIHKENLRDVSPYNTYIHKGLPPTPIAIPSNISLQAALHPQNNNFLYFVAKGDGSHQFSQTLSEHHHAVESVIKQHHTNHMKFNETLMLTYINYWIIKNFHQTKLISSIKDNYESRQIH